jgi:hypothetical protein
MAQHINAAACSAELGQWAPEYYTRRGEAGCFRGALLVLGGGALCGRRAEPAR